MWQVVGTMKASIMANKTKSKARTGQSLKDELDAKKQLSRHKQKEREEELVRLLELEHIDVAQAEALAEEYAELQDPIAFENTLSNLERELVDEEEQLMRQSLVDDVVSYKPQMDLSTQTLPDNLYKPDRNYSNQYDSSVLPHEKTPESYGSEDARETRTTKTVGEEQVDKLKNLYR